MRRTDAFVAVFQLYAEADAIAHAVAAPGAAYAGFRHSQRLSVCVTGFEARVDQLTPDFWQIVFLCAKQADTLGAGDLGIQVKFTSDAAHRHQPFRGDFTAGRAGNNGVGAVFLDIGQEVVVGILQRGVLRFQNIFVPAGGQQRANGRFTNLTAVAFTVFCQQLFKGFDAFHADEVEQFLTGVRKVLAQVIVDFDALFRQFGVENLSHQRDTAAAAGAGFGFCFQRRHGVAAFINSGNQCAFGDVKAGANLCAVRQFIHAN